MQEVVFHKYLGKLYYYYDGEEYDGTEHELGKNLSRAINILKLNLSLPYKITFRNCSKSEISKILTMLYEKNVKITGIESKTAIDSGDRNYIFTEKSAKVHVVKIPYLQNLYGRLDDCNPYKYIIIDNKKILLEVTKDYVKQNEGTYYFLAEDLTEDEVRFFDSYNTELDVDYIYKLHDNEYESKKKTKKRRIRV